jgi:hypothetical protein
MVTIRCTKKLLKYLGVDPIDEPSSSMGRLGDWYANLVSTYAGDLIMFVNEKTLITVAIPTFFTEELISTFRSRVLNLLLMLDVPIQQIEQEINHYHEVEYAKTASRSVLGSMNDIAFNYQYIAERGVDVGPLSLSDAEYKLSNMPSISRDFFPADAAKNLLKQDSRNSSAS